MTVNNEFRVGDCVVDCDSGQVVRPDGVCHVEPRSIDFLVALAQRAGRTVSRDELIDAVWGHPYVSDQSLSRCVSAVRQALGDARIVETLPKRGYRLLAEVSGVRSQHRGSPPITIAVLPLVNLSGNLANEHVADGMTELLIARLAGVPSLQVTSRTSSMHYKNSTTRLTDIAQSLNATHVVEGSVLRSPTQLQVVIQLIEAKSDTHLLTRTFIGEIAHVLRLQNEIAQTLGDEIASALVPRSSTPAVPIRGAIEIELRACA